MSGWLQKKAGLLSASKRRFFVLENSKLLYYLSADTSKQAQGFIDVHQVSKVESTDNPPYSFQIVIPGRTYFLQADSESERAKWLDLLSACSSNGKVSPRGPRTVPHLPVQKNSSNPGLSRTSGSRVSPRGGGSSSSRRDLPKDALDGEVVMSETNYVVLLTAGETIVSRGNLLLTNYRIVFVPDLNSSDKRVVSIPFGALRVMQEQTLLSKLRNTASDYTVINMLTSDAQVLGFGFSKKAANFASFNAAFQSICPASEKGVFAFDRFSSQPTQLEGWDLYDCMNEWKLCGGDSSLFRLTLANSSYKLCDSYPTSFIVPASVEDDDLASSASFRSHGRVIACVFFDKDSKALLARCSQPAVGISNNRSLADERIIHCLLETSNAQELHVFDARPKKNAIANKAAKGAGYENMAHLKDCKLTFLNIDNIHVVRGCFLALLRSCADDSDDSNFYSNASSWLLHVSLLLQGAVKISQTLKEGIPCLVHCSDGWDRTPQLCCLVMICNSPRYRTMSGFAALIEGQWISFGHQFALRQGWFSRGNDSEMAPIFFLFIDCVYQIVDQFREAFEFGEEFLLSLLCAVDSLSFGTFLANEKGRQELNLCNTTMSCWPSLFTAPKHFNRNYVATEAKLVPVTTQRAIKLWRRFFMRYSREAPGKE